MGNAGGHGGLVGHGFHGFLDGGGAGGGRAGGFPLGLEDGGMDPFGAARLGGLRRTG